MKPVVARLVVFGAAVGSLALLAGAVMLVLRLAQPTEYPVDRSRDPDGEIVGRVAKVEPGTILLTSEPPGSGVVPVVVTKDTRVMLGTIEGWMNDVRAGGQIKVAYDLYEGRKLARVVEVLPEQGARRLAPVETPAKDPAPATAPPVVAAPAAPPAVKQGAPAPPTPAPIPRPEAPAPRPTAEPPRVALPQPAAPTPPTPAPEAPAARPKVEPRRVAQPRTPTPVPAPAPPAGVTPPAAPAPPPVVPAPARPTPVAPTPVAPASPPPRPAPPAPEPPVRAQEPARPSEPDTDGSAAVDWLLKGRR